MRNLVFGLIILTVFSCKNSQDSYKTVIPEHEMQELLIDLHLSDATIRTYINYNKPVFVRKAFYDSIFTKHKVTEKQFLWNIMHYSKDKKICDIYEKAISELTSRKAVYEQKMLRQKVDKK